MTLDVRIPDIGDFVSVPVVEIPVAVGDVVAADEPILMLESDKATLDIPSPVAGRIEEVLVAVGDAVSEGTPVMRITPSEAAGAAPAGAQPSPSPRTGPPDEHASLVVLGAGPGGYTAAFRAADLGREVTLIDPRETLGGVCLNVGCIPSKALLHLAKLRTDAAEAATHGMAFGDPVVDLEGVRRFKDGVVGRLVGGLDMLARRRRVRVMRGAARFKDRRALEITCADGVRALAFDQAIIAVGSEPARLPFLPDDPRIMDSTGALTLTDVPERLLIIGGGIIGMEMAQIYHALGSRIHVVEVADQLIPGADPDIVAPLSKRAQATYAAVHTGTRVTAVAAASALTATLDGAAGTTVVTCDRILVAVGRTPSAAAVAPERAGVAVDERGFVRVDAQMRTAASHIFAIGDVVGQPMLAHKATHEGKVAAEVACGERVAFEPAAIPSVAYTDPEIAWVGLTEVDAQRRGIAVETSTFPWLASGRSLALGREEGLTKLLFDPETRMVLGAGIVGPGAGDLVAEVGLAMELGADAHDLALTIHPHPTLSETIGLAAEAKLGTLTDL